MPDGEYMTTGEVAQLLKVSRSTVSRKYDQGLLRGKTNSITGERMIQRDSVLAFMRKHNLAAMEAERRILLLCTPDEKLYESVCAVFGNDKRILIEHVRGGCDALVSTASKDYHLLIIDERLPDIICSDVLKTVKKTETAKNTRRVVVLRSGQPEEYSETTDMVIDGKQVDLPGSWDVLYNLLGLPAEVTTPRTNNYVRQWPRSEVNIPVKLSIFRLNAPGAREKGEACIVDISCGGAQLTSLTTASGTLPASAFRMIMEVKEPPLPGWRAHAQVVRLHTGGEMTLGVQFVKISKPALEQIKQLLSGS